MKPLVRSKQHIALTQLSDVDKRKWPRMITSIIQSPSPSTCAMSAADHSLVPVLLSRTSAFTLGTNLMSVNSAAVPSDSLVTCLAISWPIQHPSHTFANNVTRHLTAPPTYTHTCAPTPATSRSAAIFAVSGFTRKSTWRFTATRTREKSHTNAWNVGGDSSSWHIWRTTWERIPTCACTSVSSVARASIRREISKRTCTVTQANDRSSVTHAVKDLHWLPRWTRTRGRTLLINHFSVSTARRRFIRKTHWSHTTSRRTHLLEGFLCYDARKITENCHFFGTSSESGLIEIKVQFSCKILTVSKVTN